MFCSLYSCSFLGWSWCTWLAPRPSWSICVAFPSAGWPARWTSSGIRTTGGISLCWWRYTIGIILVIWFYIFLISIKQSNLCTLRKWFTVVDIDVMMFAIYVSFHFTTKHLSHPQFYRNAIRRLHGRQWLHRGPSQVLHVTRLWTTVPEIGPICGLSFC